MTILESAINDLFEARQELNKVKQELAIYQKALELACEELGEYCCNQTMLKHKCDSDCVTHWKIYFLKEAQNELHQHNTDT